MKIKFYPLKKNGELAKTPVYTDLLTKKFCYYNLLNNVDCEHYSYSYSENKSLYEVYLEVLKFEELDVTDQMFIGNVPIITEKIKSTLKSKVEYFNQWNINPTMVGFEKRICELSEFHRANVNNIHYCAFEMPRYVEEYEALLTKIQHLKNGKLIYLNDPEESRESWKEYKNVIDDISPITSSELL